MCICPLSSYSFNESYPSSGSTKSISRVKGVSALAEETEISRQGIQHALSEKGNPRLENINAIMQAMGYCLMPEKLEMLAEG